MQYNLKKKVLHQTYLFEQDNQSICIDGYIIKYSVYRKNVKAYRLEFNNDKLKIVMPLKLKNEMEIISRHRRWISNQFKFILNAHNEKIDLKADPVAFEAYVNKQVQVYASELGVRPNKISIKPLRSCWGTKTAANNISISLYLSYLPKLFTDYVIFHELLHLKINNHGKDFKKKIALKFSDFKSIDHKLTMFWFKLQKEVL